VSVRLVAMVLGGRLMGITRVVAGAHRRLLVRGGSPTVCASGLLVPSACVMMRGLRAVKGRLRAALRPLRGQFGDGLAFREVGLPLLKLFGARPGQLTAGVRGEVVVGWTRHVGHRIHAT
jgi:hypothetical protein